MKNLHSKVVLFHLHIRIRFLLIKLTVLRLRVKSVVKGEIFVIKLKKISLSVILFVKITAQLLIKMLLTELRKKSTYAVNIGVALSGILVSYTIGGSINTIKLTTYFFYSFFGSLLVPILCSVLSSVYLWRGKFHKDLKRSELTFVQGFVLHFLEKSLEENETSSLIKSSQLGNKFGNIVKFLFGDKNQKEIFEPIVTDWQEEYFEALFKKEMWKARWINVRYTYAFIIAMWQKSPIGDLIEFVSKIAK
jgi:hypothetical protein